MSEILVPIDFSGVTGNLVATAARLARALPARLRLLHVATPLTPFVGDFVGPPAAREARAEKLRAEHLELESLAGELKAQGVDATSRLVQGSTVDKILEQVETADVEFVMVGSRGRPALAEALFGSVCKALMKRAGAPLIVVPPPPEHARTNA